MGLKTKVTLIVASILVAIVVISRFFGIFNYALVPSAGNEPTVKKGSFLLMSNVLPYKKYKLIAYKQTNPKYEKGVYFQRLVSVEHDIIMIKNGNLFVNDTLVDELLHLNHAYKIDRAFYNDLIMKGADERDIFQIDDNYFLAQLNKAQLREDFQYERYIYAEEDTAISNVYHKKWNADNFGPIKVPLGKLFFIGDNRNASLDSRYLGFIDTKNLVGTIFYPNN